MLLARGSVDGLGEGRWRWPDTYPVGRCQQPGSLPPRTEVQGGRQADILRDRGGNPDGKRRSRLCGDPRGRRGRKPRTLPTSPKTRKARKTQTQRRPRKTARWQSQNRRRLRRRRRPPPGLAALGEAPKALQTQAAEPAAPTQAPTSFRFRTQQHRGCPVLLGDPGRHRSTQFHARRPWPLTLIKR
ncbi:unnamed protein product [Rangifer tarandus platyrhynchus]|uniref:Uncharacterized protein n=2 Tax=Rangifer tarandus platyrhynchus TaxID=3082113 RepID=A0ABN8Y1Q7_RANTA|nr:unnamed protein product [Rangifer tarandus platyrhynchus]CAI9693122.1 unnamed protein product [Rangifer tarandus platyrhynchus]